MNDKEFGARLKTIRISSGRSVSEISAHLISLGYKASEKTIYSWEAGRSQPTPDAFLDLCKFCDVPDVMGAFGYKKRFILNTEDEPKDEQEQKIMNFVGQMDSVQKDFLIALLHTVVEQNQGRPAFENGSTAETTLKSERHNQT